MFHALCSLKMVPEICKIILESLYFGAFKILILEKEKNVISNFCEKKKVNIHSGSKFLCHGLFNTSLHSIQTLPSIHSRSFCFFGTMKY